MGAFWMKVYDDAWLVGFAISLAVYATSMAGEQRREDVSPPSTRKA